MDADGMALSLHSPWGVGEICARGLMGSFNASNLLAAAGTLTLLGMDWDETLRELELVTPGARAHDAPGWRSRANRSW